MESLSSENFNYKNVEYIVECDASYNGEVSAAGWNVVSSSPQKEIMEGSSVLNINSTTECEIQAIIIALEELSEKNGIESVSIIVRTDYSGVIEKLQDNKNRNPQIRELQHSLSRFKSWSVECVDRGKLGRSHDLAKYAIHNYS